VLATPHGRARVLSNPSALISRFDPKATRSQRGCEMTPWARLYHEHALQDFFALIFGHVLPSIYATALFATP